MEIHRTPNERGAASRICVIGLLLVIGGASVWAQEPEGRNLESLSLEELLNVRIVTATARDESAAESPAVVSVLTAQQIRDLGVTTLYEALDYLPGVQVAETYWGYSAVNVRGLLQAHYNNKVLMMINGHPTRDVVNGSFHLELVPIEAIDRIEFVRGPGSSLYGTNAFAGVINIITKTGNHDGSRLLKLGGGSFSTWEASLTFGFKDDRFDILVGASGRGDSGYEYNVVEDERGESGIIDYENDVNNAIAVVKFREFEFMIAGFDQTKFKFGITPVLEYGGPSDFKTWLADLKWTHSFDDELSITARMRYDEIERRMHVRSFPFDGYMGHEVADNTHFVDGSLFAAEVSVMYEPSDAWSLLGGVEYQDRDADPYVFRFDDDESIHPFSAFQETASADDFSVFGQATLDLTERTEAILGFRYNDDSDAGSTFVPRLGLVHRLGGETYLKLLYAEAYRTPDFFEQRVATFNVLFGASSLQPEKTRNFDLVLDTRLGDRTNLQLNAFYLTTSDAIVRVPTPVPGQHGVDAAIYVNSGGAKILGIEAGLQAQPSESVSIFANYSYIDGEDRESGDDLDDVASHTVNLGLSWRIAQAFNVRPNLQYVSSRGAVDDYLLPNLVLSAELGRSVSIDLIGRNLSDEDYSYPEYVRGQIDAVPGGPGRSYLVRLYWQY